jgi:hypothetical protein
MSKIRNFSALKGLGLIAAGMAIGTTAPAQTESAYSLAAHSSIVVEGQVVRAGASEEPLLAPSSSTAVIRINRMYAGAEFAGDQTGRTATVILSHASQLREGGQALFFGEPRFIGKTLTIADHGELAVDRAEGPALAGGLQARRDLPIQMRLETATAVFHGLVEKVGPPPVTDRTKPGERDGELASEHDPEFQLAMVRVRSVLRGAPAGPVQPVLFPGSRDIMWFNGPKLKPGQDLILLAHRPTEGELTMMSPALRAFAEKSRALVVTQPYDALPASEEKRVAGLIQAGGVGQ